MDALLTTGVIAAVVSVLSTAANLLIASRARRATIEQQRWAAAFKLVEGRVGRLGAMAAHTELLRAECTLLARQLARVQRHEPDAISELRRAFSRTREQFEQFWRQWAETKGAIPDEALPFVRKIRHETATSVEVVAAHLSALFHTQDENERVALAQNGAYDIAFLNELLQMVYYEIQRLQASIQHTILSGAEPGARDLAPPVD
ncbi:MAG: hypothetical protein L0177_18340 [Chloroflexi bacterium]|nr:hypothetical protein [Chloroflexota bacterium]